MKKRLKLALDKPIVAPLPPPVVLNPPDKAIVGMKFIVTRHWLSGQFRWKLIAANNRTIAVSGESYHNQDDLLDAIKLVRRDEPIQVVRWPDSSTEHS